MKLSGVLSKCFQKSTKQKQTKTKPDFADLLGMTTPGERAWLWDYGRRKFTGSGAVVDLGCWMGSTTIPIIDGLLGNNTFCQMAMPIHVYDSFVWESWMDPIVAGTDLEGRFAPNESFQYEFELRTKKYAAEMNVRAGDLAIIGWPGGRIELLVVDAMKSWELARAILRLFYVHLIPGTSIVFHQDFCHFQTYWIHLLQYRLRKWFVCEDDVPWSPGTVFRNTGQIPADLLNREWSKTDFTFDEVTAAFAYSLGLVRDENREAVQAAKIMCLVDLGFIEQARSEFTLAWSSGCKSYDMQMLSRQTELLDVVK